MIKKIIMVIIGLIIVAGAGVLYLGANADSLIKASVEKFGTAVTQTATTLQSAHISFNSGEGTLKGFMVGNPEGFATDSAMKFGTVSVQLDKMSILGKGPIVIHNVLIDAPEMTYEVNKEGSSNLEKIQANISAFTAKLVAQATKDETSIPNTEQPMDNNVQEPERKIVIEHLTISNGRVKLSHALLAGKNLVDEKLPTIEMSDLGQNGTGMTSAALAQLVLQRLTSKAIEVGQLHLVDKLRENGIESLKGAVEQSSIGKAIGNFLGK